MRGHAFRFIDDVCTRYDVDGIEMEFMRNPAYFKRQAWGDGCTDEERSLMTAFVRRVWSMTEQVGLERGRPILIAARLPGAVGAYELFGLDVTRWLEGDLVDILAPGELELSPWEEWVELGHSHGEPVYPCLSASVQRNGAAAPSLFDGHLRMFWAPAMNVWHSGADGSLSLGNDRPTAQRQEEVRCPTISRSV